MTALKGDYAGPIRAAIAKQAERIAYLEAALRAILRVEMREDNYTKFSLAADALAGRWKEKP